jgi:hypothetical protein
MGETTPAQRPEAGGGLREANPSELTGIDGGRMNLRQDGPDLPRHYPGQDGDPFSIFRDVYHAVSH